MSVIGDFKSVRRRGLGVILGAAVLLAAAMPPASAQKPPDPVMLEALVKSSLLTFNDANITGNYTVMHAKLAKPFRDQFSPEKLKEAFQSFSQQGIDFDIIAALKPVLSEDPRIDDRGALLVRGYFETSPNRVTFTLDYIQSDGDWKLINIHVKVKPPGE
ncbi:hypothetical protein FHP25_16000 [Vineibacter terrae]|uniref:Nuclear transport factor 2 family protein n=1 Tax=Vineibacter terrae TaxID=2586908 RepID=A0A5C8PKW2_9HYPH|nr:hypothetical protein [Vineibacter terrae]TXL74587.1 hypothetical protein FHP25_16000 [Vineibacter terrae]